MCRFQRQDLAEQAEGMSSEEKKEFMAKKIKSLQERFRIGEKGHGHHHSSGCSHCPSSAPVAPGGNMPGLGPVMSSEEQANFFKALYSKR